MLVLVVSLSTISGCVKGDGVVDDGNGNGNGNGPHIINTQDTTPPVVELYTPIPNQVFSSGSSITITGKVSDGDGLYQGRIRITDDANGTILKEQLYIIHGITQYNFDVSHQAVVTAVSNFTVTVVFEDHGLNTNTATVKIKVNP